MTQNRRTFLKSSAALTAMGYSSHLFANTSGSIKPHRFIFVRKASGLIPSYLIPLSFSEKQKSDDKEKKELDIELKNHELGGILSPLKDLKENIGIIQGMSGKMMAINGHRPRQSVMNLTNTQAAPARTSIDFELAKLFPSTFNHIGFSCCESNKSPMSLGYSSKAQNTPNFVYRTPKMALGEIFGAASKSERDQANFKLSDRIYKFIHERQSSKVSRSLSDTELRKVENYRDYADEIVQRNKKLAVQADKLGKYVPQLTEAMLEDDPSVVDRQLGNMEIATQALLSGLTNVVTINLDSNKSWYTINGLDNANVHAIGHNSKHQGVPGGARVAYEKHHTTMIANMISKFKKTKEGNGTFFDNATILYFSDAAEKHHPMCNEWPFVVIAGKNSPLKLKGRYIRFAERGLKGHKHLGNFYTTLLRAHGSTMEHYGPLDLLMQQNRIDQIGAIKEFI